MMPLGNIRVEPRQAFNKQEYIRKTLTRRGFLSPIFLRKKTYPQWTIFGVPSARVREARRKRVQDCRSKREVADGSCIEQGFRRSGQGPEGGVRAMAEAAQGPGADS
jgi:hypothetical protein